MPEPVTFTIVQGDILTYPVDVVALKYARYFYGVDEKVANLLDQAGIARDSLQPTEGNFRWVPSRGTIHASHVLFVGVPELPLFRYQQIQEFSRNVLKILRDVSPNTRHIAMTLHGIGYGLDEVEAVQAEFAGIVQALQSGDAPRSLERISIVERDSDRVQRLQSAVDDKIAADPYAVRLSGAWAYSLAVRAQHGSDQHATSPTVIERAGADSDAKPRAFVAMPFLKETEDTFYFGIQAPVRAAGFSCERIDHAVFTGSIFDSIKQRIEQASVVIADLSTGNPNVYLEVGYAWGKGRPTILLTRSVGELPFDVRGHRCLEYATLRELAGLLTQELTGLTAQRLI